MRTLFDGQDTGKPPLTITVSDVAPDTILCVLLGELDLATAPRLQEKLTEAIDLAPSHLVIDLSDIQFLGSAGLNLLTDIHDAQHAAGYHVAVIVGTNHPVTRPLHITALDQILDLHTELATAVRACRTH
jgi:anti-sigma B factor antagonist